MMKGIRLQDIAKRAGVSPAAVTRVVRANGYISAEKRALVEQAMRELGCSAEDFRPRQEAGYPTVLTLLGRSAENPLFWKIAEELALAIQAQGWRMVQYYTERMTADDIREVIEQMRAANLKGVVFDCNGESLNLMSIRKYLTSLTVPLVMVERSPDIYGLNRVMLNAKESLFIAVRHLAHRGHRRIVYFGVEGECEVEQMRLAGFRAGVEAMGLGAEAVFWPIPGYSVRWSEQAMTQLTAQRGLPTAVIASDCVMVGVANYLYARGLRVPEDVSLMGLDDTTAQYMTPPLTSVAFPVAEIAQNAVRILVEAQQGERLPQNVLLSTKLVERASVAPPAEEN